ncbi:MAG: hypothetical protein JO217_01355, partial [Acidobacteriaceae bacterium]|nr:hypothetical protein [Acidobacteriaceae bacterium]
MRRAATGFGIMIAVLAAYGVSLYHHSPAPANALSGRRILYYIDPMHPSYKSDKPGIAPDCGMQLQPVWENPDHQSAAKETKLPAAAV